MFERPLVAAAVIASAFAGSFWVAAPSAGAQAITAPAQDPVPVPPVPEAPDDPYDVPPPGERHDRRDRR
ncbi:hypothetical protein [Nonomuraea aridisoli]|uniref:Small hydrophilic protein n=1 Tax=Nonomuraea aridisoli TaxID=2070368 RepID=A0A2W2E0I1_9ACTN|nr:hypothetical protein [Nonomuraea aridisoli]PZG17716.1 hypothetical protein C1J01_17245 [Nonomuraea aridisoli]